MQFSCSSVSTRLALKHKQRSQYLLVHTAISAIVQELYKTWLRFIWSCIGQPDPFTNVRCKSPGSVARTWQPEFNGSSCAIAACCCSVFTRSTYSFIDPCHCFFCNCHSPTTMISSWQVHAGFFEHLVETWLRDESNKEWTISNPSQDNPIQTYTV